MSLTSQQTRVLTQNPPLLAVWIVASFRTFYAADITNLQELGTAAAGVTANQYAGCTIDSDRQLAFVGNGTFTMYAVDISEALSPVLLGSINVGGGSDRVRTSAFIDEVTYLVNEQNNEVYIIDTSTPGAMTQIDEFAVDLFAAAQHTPVNIAARRVSGVPYVYIINYDLNSPPTNPSYLGIYDVTDSSAVVQVGALSFGVPANDLVGPPSDRTGSIQINGNVAYIVIAGNLHIVDISSPSAPTLISTTAISVDTFKGGIDSNASRIVTIGGDIELWSITNLSRPTLLDTAPLPTAGPMVDVAQGPQGAFYITFGNSGAATNLASYLIGNDVLDFQFVTSSIATGGGAALGVRPVEDYFAFVRV